MLFEDALKEKHLPSASCAWPRMLDAATASTNVVYLGPLHHVRLEDMPKRASHA